MLLIITITNYYQLLISCNSLYLRMHQLILIISYYYDYDYIIMILS
jgi:hypothetical protein